MDEHRLAALELTRIHVVKSTFTRIWRLPGVLGEGGGSAAEGEPRVRPGRR
jgi:hypothetical protein